MTVIEGYIRRQQKQVEDFQKMAACPAAGHGLPRHPGPALEAGRKALCCPVPWTWGRARLRADITALIIVENLAADRYQTLRDRRNGLP